MGAAPVTVAPTQEVAAEAPARTTRDLLIPGAVVLVLVPLIVSAWHLLVSVPGDVYMTGDLASTEMHVRDVGHHVQYVGPFSRDGWSHPGPLLFTVLALPYRLLGSSGAAMAVAALVVNGVSVAGMGLVARRRGGTGLALATLVGCAVLLHAFGPQFLAMPWNTYVTVLPYGLLLVLLWSLVCGDRWALPWAVLVATFVVQTHVGYVALALPLLAAATAWAIGASLAGARRERRAGATDADAVSPAETADGPAGDDGRADDAAATGVRVRRWIRPRALVVPGVTALALGVVLWLPPIVDQLTHEPGNMGRILRWFREGGEQTRTLLEGWRVVADQYTVPPEWIAGQGPLSYAAEPAAVYETVVPVLLVPVLAGAYVAWRRRRWPAGALVAVWALASVVGVVATARTVGALFAYRLHWAWVLGMIGGVLVLWAVWAVGVDRWAAGARRVLSAAAVAGLAVLALLSSVDAARAEVPMSDMAALVGGLVDEVEARVDELPGDDPVLLRMGSFGAVGPGLGLALELERRGVDVVVDSPGLGDSRTYEPGQALKGIVEVTIDGDITVAAELPDHELIAQAGEDDLAVLAADRAARDQVQRERDAGEITAEQATRRTEALLPAWSAAAAFLVTPTDTPADAGAGPGAPVDPDPGDPAIASDPTAPVGGG